MGDWPDTIGRATEDSKPGPDGLHVVTVRVGTPPTASLDESVRRVARGVALVSGAFVAMGGLLVAAGLSWVAARYSHATGAPSSRPSTRVDREVRKAIRRSFIATGLGGEVDLRALRKEVQGAARWIRMERRTLALLLPEGEPNAVRTAEAKLREWRRFARWAELRYAAACAAVGAVPRGAS